MPSRPDAPLTWDLFCRVIDNYGDIGVCWRLAADLAARGEAVRLWADDASALQWMAPDGASGVTVGAFDAAGTPGDVVVEAFGCDPPPGFVARMAERPGAPPVWINLEYLSAEAWVERSHGLPSPQANRLTKWFYFPGFTPATGGLLRETAQRLVGEALARSTAGMSPAQRALQLRERAELAGQEALRFGVTSFHDAGASFAEIDLFRQLAAEGALPVRLYVMVRGESNEAMDRMLSAYRTLPSGNDFLAVRSIKRQLDGALGAHGAWLLEPYSDLPDSTGLVLEPLEEIARTAEIAIKHGFQLNTHAIGDRANRELLDLYQQAWVDHGADGRSLRWRIEHAQHVAPVDQPRFAELGIIAAVQGIHCSSDGPWVPTRLGEPRTGDTSYRWRSLIDSGALVGNGTDVPVEPIDPIASYYASVTRMMANGEAFHAEQRMNRDEALASYTINNAIASFDEGRVGSIKPGKLADIVVLSADILTVDAAQIPQAQVDFTIVGGAVRYRREDSKEP